MVIRCVDAPTELTDLGRGRKRVSAFFRCVVVRSESEAASSTHLQDSPALYHRAQSFLSFTSHLDRKSLDFVTATTPYIHSLFDSSSIEVTCTIPPQLFSRTYTQLGLLVTAQESHRANLPLLCSRDRSNATGYSASATQRFWSMRAPSLGELCPG